MDQPLLPLETFRQFIGANPWHFWGLSNSSQVPLVSACNGLFRETTWQDADSVARDDIRAALLKAETKLHETLHFRVAPQYDELTLPYPRPYAMGDQYGAPIGSDGRWLAVHLQTEGYIQAMGVEALAVITANVAVTYTDADGDGLIDTFTAATPALSTTETDPLKIAAYFSSANRLGSSLDPWRIQPVRVSIAGGAVTVTGAAWLLIQPVLYQGIRNTKARRPNGYDPSDVTNYVTTIDISTRTTNPNGTTTSTSQAVLTWETQPWPVWAWACCCGGASALDSSSDPAAIADVIARAGIRHAEYGEVYAGEAVYNTTSGIWSSVGWGNCRQPDRVTLRFLAGVPLVQSPRAPDYGQMDPKWREIVCMLAAAEVTCSSKACDDMKRNFSYWQLDYANGEAGQAISAADLGNPFGTRRGQLEAWRRVENLYQTTGFTPG